MITPASHPTAEEHAKVERDTPRRRDRFRPDIEGLRAVAVVLVLLYHLWPTRLTGGFAGVDVFFVISGFLITTHLVTRLPSSGRDLGEFWARRIRRLLPAALLVLLVTLVASRLLGPETQWDNTAREVLAATFYVENWQLARTAVDYLAAEGAPSPVQHFWSLSVEEQFYLFWPVLVLITAWGARRLGLRPLRIVFAVLGVVVVASLLYSVQATATAPARAYFVTPTRIWELGVGALLAVGCALLDHRRRQPLGRPEGIARTLTAWLGLGAIMVTALAFSAETPFPSWRALLPVVGTAMVIAAHSAAAGASPTRVLGLRPVQWLGGISYSVYLWHWPLIVLVPALTGRPLAALDKVVIVAATLLLAHLTKKYVEDAFRFGRYVPSLRRSYALAAGAMALLLLAGSVQLVEVRHRQGEARQALDRALERRHACFGAEAMTPGRDCPPVSFEDIVPAPVVAARDDSDAYAEDCFVYPPFETTTTCTFGAEDAEVEVALLGNSHAGHWLPALQEIAAERNWRITTYLASACTPTSTPVEWDTPAEQTGCLDWAESVRQQVIDADFDVVLTSNRNGNPVEGLDFEQSQADWQQGYRDYLRAFDRAGVRVIVLQDNPWPDENIPDCLVTRPRAVDSCDGSRDEWLPRDPMVAAAEELDSPNIDTLDLTDRFCRADTCQAVIGGVLVYLDGHHLSATYAKTMAPYLHQPIAAALGG